MQRLEEEKHTDVALRAWSASHVAQERLAARDRGSRVEAVRAPPAVHRPRTLRVCRVAGIRRRSDTVARTCERLACSHTVRGRLASPWSKRWPGRLQLSPPTAERIGRRSGSMVGSFLPATSPHALASSTTSRIVISCCLRRRTFGHGNSSCSTSKRTLIDCWRCIST